MISGIVSFCFSIEIPDEPVFIFSGSDKKLLSLKILSWFQHNIDRRTSADYKTFVSLLLYSAAIQQSTKQFLPVINPQSIVVS